MAPSRPPSSVPKPVATLPALAHSHPLIAGGAILSLSLLLAWSVATTSYILFHDDALHALAQRARAQAAGYEAQIAEMQSALDEERSRALVARARTEATVDVMRQRQAVIEQRQNQILDLVRTGRGAGSEPTANPSAPTAGSVPAVPANAPPALRPGTRPQASFRPARAVEAELAGLSEAFDRAEQNQVLALQMIETEVTEKLHRMRSVIADLGLAAPPYPPRRQPPLTSGSAAPVGGPFVPVAADLGENAVRLRALAADLALLSDRLDRVPVRPPLPGSMETTSGFGVRIDPLLGRPAFHTGIDFRGTNGERARAAAAGTVVSAGRDGGYGLMVEIDHGDGIATRYAHLSSIGVAVGDRVAAGAALGRVGSTGRSTGLHLHYEVRIDGEPVDPQRFLRAGLRLDAAG